MLPPLARISSRAHSYNTKQTAWHSDNSMDETHIIFGHCTVLCPHTCTNYAIIPCMFSYRPYSKLDALKQTVMVLKCARQKHVYLGVLIHSGTCTHNPHSEPTSPMLSYRTDLFVDVIKTSVPKASSMSKTSEIQKHFFE